jgi:hypothetical protein
MNEDGNFYAQEMSGRLGLQEMDARDAARYRWLRERYTGFDFDWMADSDGANGKQVICFEMTPGMKISRDIDASLDAEIAKATGA